MLKSNCEYELGAFGCAQLFDSMDDKNIQHLSAIQFFNVEDQFSAVDRCMDVILQILKIL